MPKPNKVDLLRKFIAKQMEIDPFEYDGAVWIKIHLEPVAEYLGFSLRTMKTLIHNPPFRYLRKVIDGEQHSLLREGSDVTMAEHQIALQLLWKKELQTYNRRLQKTYAAEAASLTLQIADIEAKLVNPGLPKAIRKALEGNRKTFKRHRDHFIRRAEKADTDAMKKPTVPKKEFGCLRGLLDDWGPEAAPTLLACTIRNWPEFKVAVQLRQAEMEAEGVPVEYRYHDYPTITVIRRFWTVALDLFVGIEQATGYVDVKTSNALLNLIEALKAKDDAKMSQT